MTSDKIYKLHPSVGPSAELRYALTLLRENKPEEAEKVIDLIEDESEREFLTIEVDQAKKDVY